MGNCCGQSYISNLVTGKIGSGGGAPIVLDNQVLMQFQAQYLGSNPVDNQNWHHSNAISGLQIPTNFSRARFRFGKNLTLNKISWATMTKGTIGSDEAATIWLRDTDGNNIIELADDVQFNSAFVNGTGTLDIDIGEDEIYMFGWQNPTYGTNPTNCFISFILQGKIVT